MAYIIIRPPRQITVPYNRVPGYPQEFLTLQGCTAVDKWQCAWDDRILLGKQLLGGAVGGLFYPPHTYETHTEPLYLLYVKDVKTDPVLGLEETTNPLGKYTKSQLTINYNTMDYEIPEPGETTLITESIEPAAEFATMSADGLYWKDGATLVPLADTQAPGMVVRMSNWVYTIHQIPYVPSWVWTHPGYVNASTVVSRRLNRTFPPQTLLCGNPGTSREITSAGAKMWTITARLTYRPMGWNKFPRTNKDGNLVYESIYDSAGNVKLNYLLADFSEIVG